MHRRHRRYFTEAKVREWVEKKAYLTAKNAFFRSSDARLPENQGTRDDNPSGPALPNFLDKANDPMPQL
jgi:hypothetical protein